MKKTLIYVITACTLLVPTSCSNFLDENTRGKVFDNVLISESGLESALTGAYKGWCATWSYGFVNGWATEMSMGSDALTAPPSMGGDLKQFDAYDVKDTNASTANVYRGCYKAIQGANNVIANADNCTAAKEIVDPIKGEAYFIRAASYFCLVRTFGAIPLISEAVFTEAVLSVEPSPVADVYALIESDLNNAIELLGDSRRKGELGRPNKGVALGMLAEVYLTEAGWPLKETSKYALAASTAKQVLDNRAKYGLDFENSFDVLYWNNDADTGNKEDMWTIPTNTNAGSNSNAVYGYWAYPGEIGGWDVVFAEYTFYNDFPEGVRKEATFATDFVAQDGTTYHYTELRNPHPYFKKLMKDPNDPNYYTSSTSVPMRMFRFTQTALTYAEAKARSGEPDALAYECLNFIRTRAGLPTYSGLSATEFANKCVDERAWELCAERVRWYDLVRLEILADVVAKKDPRDVQPLHAITEKDYTFPLPQRDALLNDNLNKDR
jgi:hypothetical protein